MRRSWVGGSPSLILSALMGVSLWRTLDSSTLLVGVAIGIAGGAVTAVLLTLRQIPMVVRILIMAVLAAVTAGAATLRVRAIIDVPQSLALFLGVGHPAKGLSELRVVPALLTFLVGSLSGASALRRRRVLALMIPALGLGGAALLAGPTGIPLFATVGYCVVMGLYLFAAARQHMVDIPPLLGSPTTAGRQVAWHRPLLIGLPALAVALAAMLPFNDGDTFDLAQWVKQPAELLTDDNPLSLVTRLRADPPPKNDDLDEFSVSVSGPTSAGRLRLAVFRDYQPSGWQQDALFSQTGETLRSDRQLATSTGAQPVTEPVRVVVQTLLSDRSVGSGLRAVPTAGFPLRVSDPAGVRYATSPQVLLRPKRRLQEKTEYWTIPSPSLITADEVAGKTDWSQLKIDRTQLEPEAACSSPVIRGWSDQLVQSSTDPRTGRKSLGTVLYKMFALWRLNGVVNNVAGGGGQTLQSVEDFLDNRREPKNLEVFVTSFALVARCAGIPTRVVVGLIGPEANKTQTYRATDLQAWVEVPLVDFGWTPINPLPNAEEQQRFDTGDQDPPPMEKPPTVSTTPPAVVPLYEPRSSNPWPLVAGLIVVVLLMLGGWTFGIPALTRYRRRRTARVDRAVRAAWTTVTDRLVDLRVPLGVHLTPSETARASTGRVPSLATLMIGSLAGHADHALYDRMTVSEDEARTAWAYADAVGGQLRHDVRSRLAPLRHPVLTIRRLASTAGEPRRPEPWKGELPPQVFASGRNPYVDVPGFNLTSNIGVGSTSAVYRGIRTADGRPVAVKIFSYSLGSSALNHQRFRWEADIAMMVSGKPFLPEVVEAGITPTGQPYLVTALYERGTLFRRVQRAGALSRGEVLAIGHSVALALETLHQSTILHGDVKPENIFIADDGSPVLGDLGSAWLHADGGPARSMTPPYSAPEIWMGGVPSRQTDLYSLGLTLLFAATGRVPIAGSPPTRGEIEAAMGSPILVPLLEIDPKRRPRTAMDAAVLFAAELPPGIHVSPQASPLPTPTVQHESALPGRAASTQTVLPHVNPQRQRRRRGS